MKAVIGKCRVRQGPAMVLLHQGKQRIVVSLLVDERYDGGSTSSNGGSGSRMKCIPSVVTWSDLELLKVNMRVDSWRVSSLQDQSPSCLTPWGHQSSMCVNGPCAVIQRHLPRSDSYNRFLHNTDPYRGS